MYEKPKYKFFRYICPSMVIFITVVSGVIGDSYINKRSLKMAMVLASVITIILLIMLFAVGIGLLVNKIQVKDERRLKIIIPIYCPYCGANEAEELLKSTNVRGTIEKHFHCKKCGQNF